MADEQYPTLWHSGIPRGSIHETKTGYQIRINPPNGKQLVNSFKISSYGSKKETLKNVKRYMSEQSERLGLNRNQLRYISKDIIEVKLPNGQIMKTDAKHINKVLKYPFRTNTKKNEDNIKYYVMCQDGKKAFQFSNLICDYEQVEYINGDTLDLRLENLKERKKKKNIILVDDSCESSEELIYDSSLSESEETKKCSYCKIEKPLSKYSKKGKGLSYNCKDCATAMTKAYKQKKKQTISDYNKKYREENKEKVQSYYKVSDEQKELNKLNRRTNYFNKFKKLIEDRGWKCIGTIDDYQTAYSKIKVECQDKHIYEATLNNVNTGRWCPECNTNMGELIAVKALEHLFQKPFKKIRPQWLKCGDSNPLELDGYNEDLKIAVEYNGKQHYHKNNYFNNKVDKAYLKRIRYDKFKHKKCKEKGILLLEVPYIIPNYYICTHIAYVLRENGYDLMDRVDSFKIQNIKKFHSKTEELKEIIKQKGGELLKGYYTYNFSILKIKCDKGHTWKTKAKYIKNGSWCIPCSRIVTDETKEKISTTYKEFYKTTEGKKKKQETHKKRSETMQKMKDEFRANQTDKECSKCNKTLPLNKFNKRGTGTSGYQSYCRDCINAQKRLIRQKRKNNDIEYHCDECDKVYKIKDSLTRHKREQHKK